MIHFIKSLYLSSRLFLVLGIGLVFFLLAYSYPSLLPAAQLYLFMVGVAFIVDVLLLYRWKAAISGKRSQPEKLSNGDVNDLYISLENNYPFETELEIIDELPFQFQLRDAVFRTKLAAQKDTRLTYQLRPTERGIYQFGTLNVFASSPLKLIKRRYRFSENTEVPVYPSFMQLHKYELLAISNRLHEYGIKKIRRIGHSMEFEQIREYVTGDDYRTINWKATARRNNFMVNQFQDERSQQVYNLIDKGRVMKMPFEGLSLLDYAINATLVMSSVALKKGDKAGLITFAENLGSLLPATNRGIQMRNIQEVLYQEKTNFLESDYSKLYVAIRRKITQRSLLLLYTNFETLSSLKRQLPFLRKIAKQHLLVVIFFENTELRQLLDSKANNLEEIYQKTIAQKFSFEKKMIVKELQKHGIQAILTAPEHLTVNSINKYLELKARGFI